MKKAIKLVLTFLILTSVAKAQFQYTNYYCLSKGVFYALPLSSTNDCNVARCMFENFFSGMKQTIDGNIIHCNYTAIQDAHFISYPFCPRVNPPPRLAQRSIPPPIVLRPKKGYMYTTTQNELDRGPMYYNKLFEGVQCRVFSNNSP